MDAQQVYSDIQKLPALAGGIRKRSPEDIQFLQSVYLKVTGRTVYAGCKGCHIKAANYLMSLTLEQLQAMSKKKFTLKKGIQIEYPFRSGQMLTESNLTDARAAEFLINNPKAIDHFSDFPVNDAGELSLEEWYPSEPTEAVEEQPETEVLSEEESTEEKPK